MVKKVLNIFFYIIVAFYVFMMMDLFFRFNVISSYNGHASRSFNFIPFYTILTYLRNPAGVSRSWVINNVLGNIVVFIPYGLYIQMFLKNKSFKKSMFIVILTSICIEAIQFAFGIGACDIDDVILNCVGGMIGILLYKALQWLLKKDTRARTFVKIVSLLIGVPVVCLYIYISIFRHWR